MTLSRCGQGVAHIADLEHAPHDLAEVQEAQEWPVGPRRPIENAERECGTGSLLFALAIEPFAPVAGIKIACAHRRTPGRQMTFIFAVESHARRRGSRAGNRQ